jgi:dihydroflavonol-4-reductase
MPAYVNTGLNIVHVDDVAMGHLLALEKGEVGDRFILGEKDMTLQEILAEVARLTGAGPPKIRLPHGLILPVAWLAETWARVTGSSTRITIDGVRLARKMMFFSSDHAREKLGYSPRPGLTAIADAVSWFKDQGYY